MRLFAIALPAATFSLLLLGATQGYGTVVPFVGIEQIGKPVLRIVIALPVAYLLPGELPLTMAWLVPSLFGPAASWIALRHCRSRYRERRTSFDACLAAPSWRDFWSFATPRAFSSIFDISATWVGVLLLSALSTVPEAGIFTAVGRVITAGALLQLAVRLSVAPLISRMLALQELADARDLHRISTCWVVLFSWPVYTLIACFPRSVLSVFGQDFVTGASALQVLCLASIINVAIGNSQTVLLMAGKSSWHLLVTAVSFSIQIVFGIFAVHAWGILGAALSWGSAIIVENFAAALIIKYTLGFKILDRSHAYALIISLIITPMLLIAHVLIGDSLAALGIGSIAAIVVFTSLTWRYSGPLAINGLIGVLRSRTRR
ncbi:oligosaccharide flippase family protein [Streptomyces sp. 1222.5]|uniref:oligosaccharide flippase family protein n=1 Tax=Streptomyces sp. 1222.5 TaxID=1881026 RepID=UPI003D73332B